MEREPAVIDLCTMPELARLAEEVARTGQSLVLRQDGTDFAILSPARPRPRRRGRKITEADRQAALSAFGGWKGLVDAEQLKRDLDVARSSHSPLIELP